MLCGMEKRELTRYWPWAWRMGLLAGALLPFVLSDDWLFYAAVAFPPALWFLWPKPSFKDLTAKGRRWNRNDSLWDAGISVVGIAACCVTGNVKMSFAWGLFAVMCMVSVLLLKVRSPYGREYDVFPDERCEEK